MPLNSEETHRGFAMPILTGMVFLGATLLFGMEPLVGRILIPYFGGAAHVWLTSLMFFQGMLLVGYLYAHLFAQRLGRWHLLLLLLPLINLPLGATTRPSPETPLLTLLQVLLLHFALPFAVLSTTAVVAQLWLARSTAGQRHEPYPLYAASNAGSLLALFGYAFLAEPFLGVHAQSFAWTGGYIIYSALVVAAWFTLRPAKGSTRSLPEKSFDLQPEKAPAAKDYVLWLLLSSLPSAFLLTVTNFIALEVGSFPMVWVFPLALYLGSFVVTFRSNGGVPRLLGELWPEIMICGFFLYFSPPHSLLCVITPLLVLFTVCLLAHGELYERRPPVNFLTNYYLTMAFGGFLGGVAVSLLAPSIFPGLFEYPIILVALLITFWWCRRTKFLASLRKSPVLLKIRCGLILGILGLTGVFLGFQSQITGSTCQFRHRNFYGTYHILDTPPSEKSPGGLRKLMHGNTVHGGQLLSRDQRRTPILYYYLGGAIADVYGIMPSPRHIAVVGLGAGVVSAYTHTDDTLTYFEIDPDNEKIARTWFTYMDDTDARVRVVPGDGRLSMNEAAKGINYDIITIDAFTGDGIPTHLLTREAMEVYLSRLAKDGIILFHITNRYYDLRSVIKSTSRQLNLSGVMNIKVSQTQLPPNGAPSVCVALSRNPENLKPLLARGWVAFGEGDGLNECSPWTDDYINILAPLVMRFWPHNPKTSKLMDTVSLPPAVR